MSAQREPASLGIGEVLAQLRAEFPDVSTSKIRFLEAEGLIEPARSRSGYRQFASADVERLRYILTVQRDEYLPLRVIKERLDAIDSAAAMRARPTLASSLAAAVAADKAARRGVSDHGVSDHGVSDHGVSDHGVSDHGASGHGTSMTRPELLEAAGIDGDSLAELEDYGLVRRAGRHYGQDALEVARAAAALGKFGVGARHLRGVKAAADRDISLVEQVVAPQLKQRGPGAHAAAAHNAWQIATLTLWLHAALVESALNEAGLAGAAYAPPVTAPEQRSEPLPGGLRSASSR